MSDSEYERLVMIQTKLSYKINPRKWKRLIWHDSAVAEAVPMSEQLRTVDNSSASSVVTYERNVSRRKGELGRLLLSAIDEEFKRVFREEGASVIYSFIENKCELKREKFVEKPEVFSAGLQKLLASAAPVIENMIISDLCSKLGLKFEEKDGYRFSDYFREVRERWLTNE